MADIQLRFHHDMLVLSSPLDGSVRRLGLDPECGMELLVLTETEVVEEAMRLEAMAGPQCLVAPTAGITEARLAHQRLEDHGAEVAAEAMACVERFKPQHTIVEIASTRLPIDPASKGSLTANRDQYSQAVSLFGGSRPDAFLFDGLCGPDDLRCALIGARRICDVPLMVSVQVDESGDLPGFGCSIEDVLPIMVEYEASVAGIRIKAAPDQACDVVRRMSAACNLPILVQLEVQPEQSRLPRHTHDDPYYHADTMVGALLQLRGAGAQFLRAVGAPTPSYTSALAATAAGLPCVR